MSNGTYALAMNMGNAIVAEPCSENKETPLPSDRGVSLCVVYQDKQQCRVSSDHCVGFRARIFYPCHDHCGEILSEDQGEQNVFVEVQSEPFREVRD